MNIARIAYAGLCVSLSGCFAPDAPATASGTDGASSGAETENPPLETGSTDAEGTETTTGPTDTVGTTGADTDQPTTDSTGSAQTGTTSETGGQLGPVVEVTINGSADPTAVLSASEVVVEATASDDDGTVESIELTLDGRPLSAPVEKNGDTVTARFIVSGADDNGTHVIEAVALDNDGLTGSDSNDVEFDLPNGGLLEGWAFDNGEGGSVLGLHPTANGDELVWTGQVFISGDQDMRIDRVVGPAWQGNATNSDDQGSDVHPLPDGGYLAASAAGDAFDLETRLRRYGSNGTATNSSLFDGSDNGESNWPLAVEVDDAGDFYVLGVFVGPEEFESFILKSNASFTQEWKRSLSGSPMTDGTPFVYDFDVRPDGRIALAGAEEGRLWVATMDVDGQIEDQVTLVSEFDSSIAYDVAWTPAGDIAVAGTVNEGADWSRFVRLYSDTFVEQWTNDGPANGDFTMAITADDHGHIVAASTENCNFNGVSRYESCRLVLRSYDQEGTLRWQHNAVDGGSEFLGPLLFRPGAKADIEVDRFGYVYVSAFHERPLGGGETRSEWWAEQHHP